MKTPDAAVEAGYWFAMADIPLPPEIKSALLKEYAAAHRTGDPRAEIAALSARLDKVEWPWLEEWGAGFAAEGAYPYMWRRTELNRNFTALTPRIAVLAHTITNRIYVERDIRMGPGRFWRWALSAATGDCTVEASVADRYRAAVDSEDFNMMPPFFPGDRTGLRRVRIGPPAAR